MTRPVTVQTPGELLAFLFSTWPETKKTKIRSLLKHQSVTVNGSVGIFMALFPSPTGRPDPG